MPLPSHLPLITKPFLIIFLNLYLTDDMCKECRIMGVQQQSEAKSARADEYKE